MTGWAATHEPASFSNPGMAGAWLLAALAVGLLVRAALALLAPLGGLCVERRACSWQSRRPKPGWRRLMSFVTVSRSRNKNFVQTVLAQDAAALAAQDAEIQRRVKPGSGETA